MTMSSEKEIKSPFKFLNAYKKEDKDIFIGRDIEAEDLYKLIRKYRSVVVFGPSGTGKTSLIQCGLANYMDSADWYPIFLRRGQHFLNSLAEVLIKSGLLLKTDKPFSTAQLGAALKELSKNKLRPIYLIFDQFEELIILGDRAETDELIDFFQLILNNEEFSFCNLIFSIREEYIGSMEPLVATIPEIMDHRLRLQSMLREMTRDVITKSCEKFDITINTEDVETILNKLEENGVIQLPYLQVYLDQLWREDYARTLKEKNGDVPLGESGFPKLEFTSAEIEAFGDMKDVIQRFLTEQTNQLEEELLANPEYEKGMLDKILDSMVTNEGTKLPLEVSLSPTEIKIKAKNPPLILKDLEQQSPEMFTEIFSELEERRILSSTKNHYELAHDKIAELIFQKRTREELKQKETIQQLKSFKEKKIPLTNKQLYQIEDVMPNLDLDSETRDFYLQSKRRNTTKKALLMTVPLLIIIVLLILMVSILKKITSQLYAVQMFDRTIPTISDKKLALSLADYIYTKKDDQDYRTPLNESYNQLYRQPEIQSELSVMNLELPRSFFRKGDFHISDNGDFLVVKTTNVSENYGSYTLYGRKGDLIENFDNKTNYVYFLNQPDILLVAVSGDDEWNTSIYTNYPSKFYLYDCRKQKRLDFLNNGDLVIDLDQENSILYPKSQLVDNRSPDDSYRIRFNASGSLIVPFIELTDSNKFIKKVRIYDKSNKYIDIQSSSTVGLSKDKKLVMTGYDDNEPIIEIWNDTQKVGNIKGSYFADFTEKGSVVYIKDELLKFKSPFNETQNKQYKIEEGINYAHVGGDEKFAIVESNKEKFYIYDLINRKFQAYNEKIAGFNFRQKSFISINNLAKDTGTHAVYRRSFGGALVDTALIKAGVREVVYNDEVDNLLVLDSSYNLHLLDNKLKTKAIYQLSSNDLFGFSKNGMYIYYLRDNSLNLLDNKPEMVNLFDPQVAREWYKSKPFGARPLDKQVIQTYLPPEPGSRRWFRQKVQTFFGKKEAV